MLWGGVPGIQARPGWEASEGSRGEMGSAFQRNADPTSQPAAHSIALSHSLLPAALSAIRNKAPRAFLTHPAV